MNELETLNPEAIYRKFMADNGRKGGLTKTPARLKAMAKARRARARLRKARLKASLGIVAASIG